MVCQVIRGLEENMGQLAPLVSLDQEDLQVWQEVLDQEDKREKMDNLVCKGTQERWVPKEELEPLEKEEMLVWRENQERGAAEEHLDLPDQLVHGESGELQVKEVSMAWMVLLAPEVQWESVEHRVKEETRDLRETKDDLERLDYLDWEVYQAGQELMENKDPWVSMVHPARMVVPASRAIKVSRVFLAFRVHQDRGGHQ
jgi:hypothetical protein